MSEPSVLFVSKNRKDPLAEEARSFIAQNFPRHEIVLGQTGEKLPEQILNWDGDYIISYLAPWIIPQRVLNRARNAAINFHPGPPDYPGIGCYNFAIYDGVDSYGITCHHMARAVDTGRIVEVRRFPVFPVDTVLSIAQKSSAQLLMLFYDVMSLILNGNPLPESGENWTRKPYTKSEMYDLFRITTEMSDQEIKKRIKAATFPGWPGAFIEIGGQRFYHQPASVNGKS